MPLIIIANMVERAPIVEEAYPDICSKGSMASAFKLPKIIPKKEKLNITNIENQIRDVSITKLTIKRFEVDQIIRMKENNKESFMAPNFITNLEFMYDEIPSMAAIAPKINGKYKPKLK